nr:MAG TPA: hypothetical protein [Caudoviricetes sp.]
MRNWRGISYLPIHFRYFTCCTNIYRAKREKRLPSFRARKTERF